MTAGKGVTLGVVLPCRDEAAVLERKLGNLALVTWPPGQHQIVVVDDHSTDGTFELASSLCARLFDASGSDGVVHARAVRSTEAPGKPGAIATGISAVATGIAGAASVDLIALTDADVVIEPRALVALAAAFEARPELAMACGAQWFVRDLDPGGAFRARDGGAFVRADGRYDRWTAAVRRFESRTGRLFSVHGQLLAWRAELDLQATAGLAADDLDLRHQVRARSASPRRIELVQNAIFAERKEVAEAHEDQGVRRARAYLQTVSWRAAEPLPEWLDRLQLGAYRFGPVLAPWLLLIGLAALPLLAWATLGVRSAWASALVLAVLAFTPPARRLARLMGMILRAQRAERAEPLGDRWKMARR